jgi:hypothetical protein
LCTRYRRTTPPLWNLTPVYSEALELFASLSLKYGARFADLSHAVTNLDYLYNQDHLNIKGSEVLTRILLPECFG